jgi:hypothetical protein
MEFQSKRTTQIRGLSYNDLNVERPIQIKSSLMIDRPLYLNDSSREELAPESMKKALQKFSLPQTL